MDSVGKGSCHLDHVTVLNEVAGLAQGANSFRRQVNR
jgi:hypothetical protein